MLNLLYLSQYHPPEIGAGAVRSKFTSSYLAKNGWSVDVVCERPNYPDGELKDGFRDKRNYKEEVHKSLTIHRVWSAVNKRSHFAEQLWFYISFMMSGFFYVLQNPKKYDLIYASSPPAFVGISGLMLSKIIGTKFVIEIRDIWPDVVLPTHKNNSFLYRVGQLIEKWIYSSADLIVSVTEPAEEIIRNRSGSTPVVTIPNGVDVSLFEKIDQPENKMDGKYDKLTFRVGYIGSLGFIHDLKTFVEAAKLCEDDPSIRFVIIGDGRKYNELTDLISSIKPNNLDWIGLKSHQKIPSYISSFDLAINPIVKSKAFESIITVKFYEYLACGTPVITCGKGANEKIGIRSKAAVTIEPENAALLANTIKELKSKPTLLKKMSIDGTTFIQNNYSRKEASKKLLHELEKLIHK
ncbi:MAG: glycosyltransferase family 4 protein [Balneolaceae bacterium]